METQIFYKMKYDLKGALLCQNHSSTFIYGLIWMKSCIRCKFFYISQNNSVFLSLHHYNLDLCLLLSLSLSLSLSLCLYLSVSLSLCLYLSLSLFLSLFIFFLSLTLSCLSLLIFTMDKR